MTLLTGDVREVLATLPAESVQTCVTSPPSHKARGLRASIIQCFDRVKQAFSFSDALRRLLPFERRSSESCSRTVLAGAEGQGNVCLAGLDSEMGAQRGDCISCNKVGAFPTMQKPAVSRIGLLCSTRPAKRLFQEGDSFGLNLLDTNALLILRVPVFTQNALAIRRPLDADIPIRVDNAREISQDHLVHTCKYTTVAAVTKGGDAG